MNPLSETRPIRRACDGLWYLRGVAPEAHGPYRTDQRHSDALARPVGVARRAAREVILVEARALPRSARSPVPNAGGDAA